MSQRKLIAAAVVFLALGGWFLFRPERLVTNTTVSETLPDVGSAVALAEGMFHSGAHETKGSASIHRLPSGARVLRLTDFATSNGPDVRVYLVAATDATDDETVTKAGFVELGKLKGNIGDQNYDVPADLDLSKYRAVTIWCKRFGVNFGTAPLNANS